MRPQCTAAHDYRPLGAFANAKPHMLGSDPRQNGTMYAFAGLGHNLARFIIMRGNDGPPAVTRIGDLNQPVTSRDSSELRA